MVSIGDSGRDALAQAVAPEGAVLGGEYPYDWPPLGDQTGIKRGREEPRNWRSLWKALARRGRWYDRERNRMDRKREMTRRRRIYVMGEDTEEDIEEDIEEGIEEGMDEDTEEDIREPGAEEYEGWCLESVQQYLHVAIREILGESEHGFDDRMFPAYFTLGDLEYMGNFNIVFTDNLLQHLRVVKQRDKFFKPTVYIFQHGTILEKLSTRQDNMIPCHVQNPKLATKNAMPQQQRAALSGS